MCEECASSIAAAEAPGPGLNSGVSRQSSSAVAPLKNPGLRSTELFFFLFSAVILVFPVVPCAV